MHAAIDVPRDEPGGFEHAQMARDRGRRHAVQSRQLTDERGALGEPLEHVAPHRVGQGGEDVVEWVASIVNHVVNSSRRAKPAQARSSAAPGSPRQPPAGWRGGARRGMLAA